MKIAILGAGGVRTPLLLQALASRQERLGLDELALMDIDAERLALMAAVTASAERGGQMRFRIVRTTDAEIALANADYVITTFRVGGTAGRVADERVPLRHGVLGQETTGPGGFALALRSIPVLLAYLDQMQRLCPQAWLINFANPAGLLAEAATRVGGWPRTVGICDAPAGMARVAAALLAAPMDEVFLDYFGLNHLGWVRAVTYRNRDHLPEFMGMIRKMDRMPGLPFHGEFIVGLGLIPNEYLYYYYHDREAVANILRSPQTRGEQIAAASEELFAALRRTLAGCGDPSPEQADAAIAAYHGYLNHRGETYMAAETAGSHTLAGLDPALLQALAGEGYAGVALDLDRGPDRRPAAADDPERAQPWRDPRGWATRRWSRRRPTSGRGVVQPLAVGAVPGHALGLMQQVKAYEAADDRGRDRGIVSQSRAGADDPPIGARSRDRVGDSGWLCGRARRVVSGAALKSPSTCQAHLPPVGKCLARGD